MLGGLALQAMAKMALHGRRTDPLTAAQTAAVDAIQVPLEDGPTVR